MNREIDERIVSMELENKQFEKNAKTSIKTLNEIDKSLQFKNANKGFESAQAASSKFGKSLTETATLVDKLKQSLQLKGGTAGLEAVQSAAQKCDMSTLGTAIDKIHVKFSALEIMAVTALSNITNQAVNTGKRMTAAFTIDPVKTGFQEYETQINSVQTILANTESKGATLQDVNAALAELNTYADKTIYNFTEMTRNIGTFTAAGVELKTSVAAIKGIANLAAVSGSNAQQASTAMYQLSQALASGTVKLMDWNSVVNAGMGGQVFQDSLKETARVHGINIDAMIKKEGSFRETLQNGWLTAEILTETLSKFTGDLSEKQLKAMGYTEEQIEGIMRLGKTANDAATKVKTFTQLFDTLKEASQSGWTKTWEILIGDFGEAKGLLTEISDMVGGVIGKSNDMRNNLLGGALSTGWKQLLNEGIHDNAGFEEMIANVAKGRGVDFDNIIKAESISEFTKGLNAMSKAELKNAGYTKDQVKELNKLNKSVQAGTMTIEEYSEASKQYGADFKSMLTDEIGFIDALKKSLKEGKLESDVISESVSKFTEKINGMSEAEIEAAGYTKEQIDKLNEMNEKFKEGTLSAEKFAELITRPSGRELLIESLRNSLAGLLSVLKPIGDAFKKVFPAATADQLYDSIKKFRDWTATLKLGEDQAKKLKSTFEGLFSVLSIIVTIIKKVTSGAIELIGSIFGLGDSVLSITSIIGKGLSKIRKFVEESDVISSTVEAMTKVLTGAVNVLKTFLNYIGEKVEMPGLSGISKVLDNVGESMKKLFELAKRFAGDFVDRFTSAFSSGELSSEAKSWIDVFNSTILGSILLTVSKFFKSFSESIESFGGIGETIQGLTKYLKAMTMEVEAKTLFKIASAVGILAAAVWVLSTVNPKNAVTALAAVLILFKTLQSSLSALDLSKSIKGIFAVGKLATAMISLSVSVLILAGAVKKLSSLNLKELAIGLGGTIVLMQVMARTVKSLASSGKGAIKGATQMVILASAIKILASACADLGKLGLDELAKGVTGIGVILLEFVGFQKLMDKVDGEKMFTSAAALVVMGAAMKIFADVAAKFGSMEWEELGKAGAAITSVLALATGFGALARYQKDVMRGSEALVVIGIAMEIFANVAAKFGSMKWEELGKAGAAMTGILALATGFGALARFQKDIGGAVAGLTVMAIAMGIFANVCEKFGSMEWEELGKAGAAIGGVLALATGFGVLARFAPDILKASSALLIMSAALLILTPALKALGGMSIDQVFVALTAIAGVFLTLGVSAMALGPLVGTILALSGAIAVLGAACLMIGAGTMLFAAGLGAMATSAVAGAVAIISALEILIVGIIGLIPAIATALSQWVVTACNIIVSCSSSIGSAIKALVLTLVDVLVQCVPALADGALKLIVGVLAALVEYTPTIVEQLFDFLIGIINGIAVKLPDLILAVSNLITALFQGVIDAVSQMDPAVIVKGLGVIAVLGALIYGLSALAPVIPAAAVAIGEIMAVLAILGGMNQIPGLGWLVEEGGELLEKIGKSIGKFVGGLVGGIAEGFTNSMPTIADNLSSFMTKLQPFLDGVSAIDPSILDSVKALAGAILALTAANLMDAITNFLPGDQSLEQFGAQIAAFAPYLKTFNDAVIGITPETFTTAAEATKLLAQALKTIPFDWGHNEMTLFGDQLASFGPDLKEFNDEVIDITPDKLKAAAESTKILAEALKAIPSDWGHNELIKFGEQLTSFGPDLKDFSKNAKDVDKKNIKKAVDATKSLADIAKVDSGDLAALSSGINSFTTAIKSMSVLDANTISAFNTSLTSVSTKGVDAFINAFKDAGGKAKKAVDDFVKAAKKASDAQQTKDSDIYTSFLNLGGYLTKGFAKGITDNKYRATNAGKDIAKAAYDAAKKELEVNSPSKKFMPIGGSTVEGFVKGITDNLGDVKDSAKVLGSTMLDATQKVLKINSPSLVFNKEVGRYIVQGIAEGIKKDMSAEEAAQQKAQNIVNAFKNEIDKYGRKSSNAEKEYDIWSAGDGKYVSEFDKSKKHLQLLKDNLIRESAQMKLAHDEWQETIKYMGEGSKEAEEAYGKYLDSIIKMNDTTAKIEQVGSEMADTYKEIERTNRENRDLDYEHWLLTEGRNATQEVKDAKYLENLNNQKADARIDMWRAEDAYIELYNKYNDKYHPEVLAALNEYKQKRNEYASISGEILDNDKAIAEREKAELSRQYDLASDNADIQYQIWEKTLGRKATDEEKEIKKLGMLSTQMTQQAGKIQIAQNEWNEAINEFGSNSIEAQEAYNAYLQEQLNLTTIQSEITDIQESIAKREKRLQDKQVTAKREYSEYMKKYKQYYLDNGMTLEELERDAKLVSGYDPSNTVTSMVTKTSAALGNIQNTYQYKNVMTSFTNMGTSYIDAVNEGVTNKTPTLINSMVDMLAKCTDSMKEKQQSWFDTGAYLVDGFVKGIQSKIVSAAEAAAAIAYAALDAANSAFEINSPSRAFFRMGAYAIKGLVGGLIDNSKLSSDAATRVGNSAIENLRNSLKAISEVVASEIDTQPTIRPVLDLSGVESGTARISSMLSTSKAMSISASMSGGGSVGIQNGPEAAGGDTTYQFVQNNYSPKALSRSEIYRQTHNQFSTFRRTVTE